MSLCKGSSLIPLLTTEVTELSNTVTDYTKRRPKQRDFLLGLTCISVVNSVYRTVNDSVRTFIYMYIYIGLSSFVLFWMDLNRGTNMGL